MCELAQVLICFGKAQNIDDWTVGNHRWLIVILRTSRKSTKDNR
jgi:hypothetical protein